MIGFWNRLRGLFSVNLKKIFFKTIQTTSRQNVMQLTLKSQALNIMLHSYSGTCMHEKIDTMKIKMFADKHLHVLFYCNFHVMHMNRVESAERFGSGLHNILSI